MSEFHDRAPGPGVPSLDSCLGDWAARWRWILLAAGCVVVAILLAMVLTTGPSRALQMDLGYENEDLTPPEDLVGQWSAVLPKVGDEGHPQPVTLRIDEVKPGKTAGKMTFASPRRCVVDLEYGGPHEGRHIFYMIRFTNCFDYDRKDFIALSQVPREKTPEPGAERSLKNARIVETFDLAPSAAEPAEPTGPTLGGDAGDQPQETLDRIVYAISLGGVERETAVLSRE